VVSTAVEEGKNLSRAVLDGAAVCVDGTCFRNPGPGLKLVEKPSRKYVPLSLTGSTKNRIGFMNEAIYSASEITSSSVSPRSNWTSGVSNGNGSAMTGVHALVTEKQDVVHTVSMI